MLSCFVLQQPSVHRAVSVDAAVGGDPVFWVTLDPEMMNSVGVLGYLR